MIYKVYVTKQFDDGSYHDTNRVFKRVYYANKYYNEMAQDKDVVNLEIEVIK